MNSGARVRICVGVAIMGLPLLAACARGPEAPPAVPANEPGDPAGSHRAADAPSSATTTTETLGDAGDLQAGKLAEASAAGHVDAAGTAMGRTAKDIQAAVLARRDEARACYDGVEKRHPGIQGDVSMKWVIDRYGIVSHAEIDPTTSTLTDPDLARCLASVLTQLRFPLSEKGFETRAHYPFNFHPRPGR